MLVKASINSIEALHNWFMQAKKPFWSIYTGFSKDAKDLAMKNSSLDDLERSWELMHDIVKNKTANGGRITIYITETANSSHGYTEYMEVQSSIAAISGPSMIPGYVGGVDTYIADKLALYDKDRKIEELQARLEEKEQGTGIQKVINRVLEEAPISELIMALATKFLGTGALSPAINGAKNPRITDDLETEELGPEDQQRLADAITRISVHFPDIVGSMEKLAAFIESNPVMAKTLVNQMK